jgi:4-amino-4-deoxy-L-arabinose transferase-like glycosyltransferase
MTNQVKETTDHRTSVASITQLLRHQAWIVFAAGTILFTNLGVPHLWDDDEAHHATCAREMLTRGDWVVPIFNESLSTHKPALLYWLIMSAYEIFGINEFAARFWSAVLAVGTALMTYHIGRMLFRAEVGLWAGLVLASSLVFDISGRAATPDATLVFCSTLAMFSFVWGGRTRERTFAYPTRWLPYALAYGAMGLAVLDKGPVGVVLPAGVIGLYLCWLGIRHESMAPLIANPASNTHSKYSSLKQSSIGFALALWNWLRQLLAPYNVLKALRTMRPLTGLVIVAAIALPWYIAVWIATDGEWVRGFVDKHNVSRFLKPMEGHKGPIFYYVLAILVGMFPWSVFLPLSLVDLARRIRERHSVANAYLFLACWSGLYIVFFSLSQTKLPNYVLPAVPALAIVIAVLLDRWISAPASISRGLLRLALGSIVVGGVVILVALPIVAATVLPGEAMLGLYGLGPVVGAMIAWYWMERQQAKRAVVSLAITAVVLATTLFGLASVRVSEHQNSVSLLECAHQGSPKNLTLAMFGHRAPSLVFYAGQQVRPLASADQVAEFFRTSEAPFLVTRANRLAELQGVLPDGVTVLMRQQRFLKKDEVVLLGRTPRTAGAVRKIPN